MSNETGEVLAAEDMSAASLRPNSKRKGRIRVKPAAKKRAAPAQPDKTMTVGARQKAVDVTLSDGRHIYMREPKATELSLFLRAELVLTKMRDVIAQARSSSDGLIGLPAPEINDRDMGLINPLLARLSGLSEAEVAGLGLFDWMGLLMALYEFFPKNARRTAR